LQEANLSNCVVTKLPCYWDMANYGGLTFSPDYLPTGEIYFLTGTASNPGGYSNAENDAMIEKTLTNPNLSYMYSWEDYLAKQLPMEWQPNPAHSSPRSRTTSGASRRSLRRCPSTRRTGTS
jgi:peptide/nickel transport system substrate-binding protein